MKLRTIARTLIASMLVGMLGIAPAAADDTAASEPVVMSFSQSASNTTQYTHPVTKAGSGWQYASIGGGDCVKLTYHETEDYAPYCYMPKFVGDKMVTDAHKYVCLVFMTTELGKHRITITNSLNGEAVVLASKTYTSAGKWVTTAPVEISSSGILSRFISGRHSAIEFTAEHENAQIYLKEMVFFTSEAQANAYRDAQAAAGDNSGPLAEISGEIVWDFSNLQVMESMLAVNKDASSQYGEATVNGVDCIEIKARSNGNILQFRTTDEAKKAFPVVPSNNSAAFAPYYMAITYMATGSGSLSFNVTGRGKGWLGKDTSLAEATAVSDKWVTAVGKQMGTDDKAIELITRQVIKTNRHYNLTTTTWLQLNWANTAPENNLYVKEIVFFKNEKDAMRYASEAPEYYNSSERSTGSVNIKIGDASLENYSIVISKDANAAIESSARRLQTRITNLIGKKLPIITDDTAASEHEILVGNTDRAECESLYGADAVYGASNAANVNLNEYSVKVIDGKLIFASAITLGVEEAVSEFVDTYFHNSIEGTVSLSPDFSLTSTAEGYTSNNPTNTWATHANVAEPTVFTEDFTADNGYFTEEDGADNWKYENGTLVTKATDELALSYIHVYEYNAALESDFTYKNASDNAQMGITLRYTAKDAYIRAGYDFQKGEWYIDTREGYDFEVFRVASGKTSLTPGTTYRLAAKVDGDVTTLSVNGTEVLRATATTQVTPGRVGVYAKGVEVSVDNARLIQLSGEGTVFRNVNHTIISTFIDGGSTLVMNDGALLFTRDSLYYASNDGGVTWEETKALTDYTTGTPSFLRLSNGDWLKINVKTLDGVKYFVTELSSDDGKTWTDGGIICPQTDEETGKPISNMNDTVTQMRSGRIFTSMSVVVGDSKNSWYNFVVFYYSDDNGVTWHISLDSRYIEGNNIETNELAKYFAEARIIQCADGRIRMLCSWNNYGCFVYCDSFDNGETWGPLEYMNEFTCNRSSYAIARDPYAANDTTYYMVWCYDLPRERPSPLPRSRFALAKSIDGMNWEYIGDVWRWESADCVGPNPANGNSTLINQIINPSIMVSEDKLIIGAGISEYCYGNVKSFHNVRKQHVWTIGKDTLTTYGIGVR